ncbi:MAG: hypothetical protein WCD12_05940 [Candidatus Binatus sp.]|jgi:hypothetical protein|uniref:hypothetical protein n=1 Tax=Candidatus Binatus sp. TaxID=2811406 RepID=UPI003C709387
MNCRLLLVLIGVVATVGFGCAVQGKPFEKISSPPGNAVIYVYRPYSYASSLILPAVTCGEDTVRIGPGGYHAFVVPAGEKVVCSVQTDAGADEVDFQTERRSYYVREELGWGAWTSMPHLNPVDTDKAHTEIQSCVQEPSIDQAGSAN